MGKAFLGILIAAVVIFSIMGGGSTSSTLTTTLDDTKVADTMAEISTAIDVAGSNAFVNTDVKAVGFKGTVEQPASRALGVTTHVLLANSLKLKFALNGVNTDVSLLKEPSTIEANAVANANLNASLRKHENLYSIAGLIPEGSGLSGIAPVIKSSGTHSTWINNILFSKEGLNLEQLSQYSDIWDSLKGETVAVAANRQLFLAWMIGKGGAVAGDVKWEWHKTGSLMGMKQVNVASLSSLNKNNAVIASIIDPNRMFLYEVFYVNRSNIRDLVTNLTLAEAGVTVPAAQQNQFVSDLANHVSQRFGQRVIAIPNSDTSQLFNSSGDPIFIIN